MVWDVRATGLVRPHLQESIPDWALHTKGRINRPGCGWREMTRIGKSQETGTGILEKIWAFSLEERGLRKGGRAGSNT